MQISHHELKMESLLSLPDPLIELVAEHVIGIARSGLREWCRVTSLCKRLWHMQLPESYSTQLMFLDADYIEGESKMSAVLFRQCKLLCMCR